MNKRAVTTFIKKEQRQTWLKLHYGGPHKTIQKNIITKWDIISFLQKAQAMIGVDMLIIIQKAQIRAPTKNTGCLRSNGILLGPHLLMV